MCLQNYVRSMQDDVSTTAEVFTWGFGYRCVCVCVCVCVLTCWQCVITVTQSDAVFHQKMLRSKAADKVERTNVSQCSGVGLHTHTHTHTHTRTRTHTRQVVFGPDSIITALGFEGQDGIERLPAEHTHASTLTKCSGSWTDQNINTVSWQEGSKTIQPEQTERNIQILLFCGF